MMMCDNLLKQETLVQIKAAARSQRGRQRETNEDVAFCQVDRAENGGQYSALLLVCDGMGGHRAGHIASRLAAGTVSDIAGLVEKAGQGYGMPPPAFVLRELAAAVVQAANQEVFQYAQANPQQAGGMGTTVTLALVYGTHLQLAQVGDSRAYLWRAGRLTQLTQDHSLAAEMARQDLISIHEIGEEPQRNILLRAVGNDETVEVDLFDHQLQPGDRLLLCSDGLWSAFPGSEELAERLGRDLEPAVLCERLLAETGQRDGSDDSSVVVAHINEAPNQPGRLGRTMANLWQRMTASTL